MPRFSPVSAPLLAVLLLSACAKPKDLVFTRVENFGVRLLGLRESVVGADVYFYNPNGFALQLRRADFDVYLNGRHLGRAGFDTLLHMPARDTFALPIVVRASAADALSSGLGAALAREVKIRLDGSVKAGKGRVFIRVPVNYETTRKLR